MYKEIFRNGVTEESLNMACKYAKAVVKNGIEFRENIRNTVEFYNCEIIFEDLTKNSWYDVIKKHSEISPTAKIDYIPTKKYFYDGGKAVKEWISDEAGQWQFR